MASDLGELLTADVGSVTGTVASAIAPATASAVSAATIGATAITPYVTNANAVQNVTASIGNLAASSINGAAQSAPVLSSSVSSGVAQALTTALNGANTVVPDVVSAVQKVTQIVGNLMASSINGTTQSAPVESSSVPKGVTQALTTALNGANMVVPDVVNAVQSGTQLVGNLVVSSISSVTQAASSAINAVESALQSSSLSSGASSAPIMLPLQPTDTTPPQAPVIDSVIGNSAGIVTVTGAATPGDTVTVFFLNGSNITGVADSGGHFSISSAVPLQTSGDGVALTGDSKVYKNIAESNDNAALSSTPQAHTIGGTASNHAGVVTVTGMAQSGSLVTVTFPDGSTNNAVADSTGHYSVASLAPQGTGELAAVASTEGGTSQPSITPWTNASGGSFIFGTNQPSPPTVSSTTENSAGLLTITGTAEAGSTVTVIYADGSSASGTAGSGGSYSITSSLAQAAGTESVTATDTAGTASVSTSEQWMGSTPTTIDTVSQNPDGTLTVMGSAPAGDGVSITFGDGSTASGMVDNSGHYSVSSSTAQTAGIETATFTDSADTTVTVTSDWTGATPPAAPTVSSATENSAGLLTITGHAEAGSAITVIYADGSSASGNYSITSPSAQAAGTETITAIDTAGNTSASTSEQWTGSNPTTIDTVSQNPDGTLTVTGSAPAGDIVCVTFSDSSTATGTVDNSGHYSVSSSTVQTAGIETATFTDSAGDTATVTNGWTDTTPPAAPTIDSMTNNPNADYAVTVTGTAEANSTVTVTFTDGSTATGAVGADGHYSVTSLTPEPNGEVFVITTAAAGNHSPITTQTITAGDSLLQITGVTPETGASPFITSDNALVIHGTLSQQLPDPSSGQTESVQVSIDGGPLQVATINGTTWTYDDTANPLSDGLHTVQAYLTQAPTPNPNGATSDIITNLGQATQLIEVSASGALNLSLQDVLSDVKALSLEGAAAQQVTINGGGVVTTVNLAEGVGAGAGQWQDSGTSTVNGVLYDVYHNTTEGANTAADLLIQHGIHVI